MRSRDPDFGQGLVHGVRVRKRVLTLGVVYLTTCHRDDRQSRDDQIATAGKLTKRSSLIHAIVS